MQNDAKYAVVGFSCRLAFGPEARESEHLNILLENLGNAERLHQCSVHKYKYLGQ